MPTRYSPSDIRNGAFTLMEMLVSTAVLALLIILIVQLVNSASLATLGTRKRIDSDATARSTMGIMANDFAKMVQRPMGDVDYIFAKITGNDKVFFYSEAPGYMPSADLSRKSTASLVGYRINNETFQLERLGKALTSDGAGTSMVFLSFAGSAPNSQTTLAGTWPTTLGSAPDYNGSDNTDYHAISDEIFRFEFCFMTRSGGYFQPSSSWQPLADDNNDGIPNIKDVRAIVVTVAALDKMSRQLVTDMSRLAQTLDDSSLSTDPSNPTTDPSKLVSAVWKAKIESRAFASEAGIPQIAAGAIRVYQRVFYLQQ